MIRCATMQSALLRYLSSKYCYSILGMMMMPKEGMVCFIVFFITKKYGLVKKSSLYLNYWESYDNFIDFMAAILNFSFKKESFKNDSSTSAEILLWVLSMHNQKRNKLFFSKNKATPMITEATLKTTLNLQTKILKNTLCTRVYSGSATGRDLLPPSILGGRV